MTRSCPVSSPWRLWPSCACGVEANTSKGKPCTCCEAPSHCRAPGGSRISRSGSLQQLAPESGAIVSCRRSCPGHAADEDEEEEVDEEEEEDEEEEKEAMEKEPHLIQMRLALADISENLLTLLSCCGGVRVCNNP